MVLLWEATRLSLWQEKRHSSTLRGWVPTRQGRRLPHRRRPTRHRHRHRSLLRSATDLRAPATKGTGGRTGATSFGSSEGSRSARLASRATGTLRARGCYLCGKLLRTMQSLIGCSASRSPTTWHLAALGTRRRISTWSWPSNFGSQVELRGRSAEAGVHGASRLNSLSLMYVSNVSSQLCLIWVPIRDWRIQLFSLRTFCCSIDPGVLVELPWCGAWRPSIHRAPLVELHWLSSMCRAPQALISNLQAPSYRLQAPSSTMQAQQSPSFTPARQFRRLFHTLGMPI